MIKWSDIEAEVGGFRENLVEIFKKYEGMRTDEMDGRGSVVKVTASSFARHMGIADSTFKEWVAKYTSSPGGGTSKRTRPGPDQRAIEEAAAQAKAQAEAKAAQHLAKALEQQKRESALAEAKRAEEAARKIRAEEQAKAKEAAAKEIAKLREDLAKAAAKAEFDVNSMTAAQKQQVMTMLANDPDKAAEWFKAQTAERSRKLAEAEKKAKADAERKKSQMAERESRKAAERARSDYNSSALRAFISVTESAEKMLKLLNEKPITFDHILASGLSAGEWVKMTELVEDMAVEVREAIFAVNAEQELSEL